MSAPFALFVGWQDDASRRWHAVGRLREMPGGLYEFVYTRGFIDAQRAGMGSIVGFDEASTRYVSDELFPLFRNRIMSRTRADYPAYVHRLGLPEDTSPMMMLARSEGRRNTDPFVLFAEPSLLRTPDGQYQYDVTFFVHGTRYVPAASQARLDTLAAGEPLWPMWDWQNPKDAHAVMLRTADNHAAGWVPRFYVGDVRRLREAGARLHIEVVKVNTATEPYWARVLCRLRCAAPPGFRPLASEEFEPLAAPELLVARA